MDVAVPAKKAHFNRVNLYDKWYKMQFGISVKYSAILCVYSTAIREKKQHVPAALPEKRKRLVALGIEAFVEALPAPGRFGAGKRLLKARPYPPEAEKGTPI